MSFGATDVVPVGESAKMKRLWQIHNKLISNDDFVASVRSKNNLQKVTEFISEVNSQKVEELMTGKDEIHDKVK